jgi:hypothetical protein
MLQSFNNPPFSVVCPLLFAPVALASSVGLRRLWEKCQVSGRRSIGRLWIPGPSAAGRAGSAADPPRLRLKFLVYQLRRQVGDIAAFKPCLGCSH